MRTHRFVVYLTLLLSGVVYAEGPTLKSESFDKDPGWEGLNNIVELKHVPTVAQSFGYSETKFASKEKGEIGGRITRAAHPASYALKLPTTTLDQKFSASGTFAFTGTTAGSGFFFGFFNSDQPGATGRPVGSLGLDFDGEKSGARLAIRLITHDNQSCGTFVTPFIPGKFRPTPIHNDGTHYQWTLAYDPDANNGGGQFHFRLTSNNAKPEAFEGKDFSVNLPPGYKKQGTIFDRFGLQNGMKAGGTSTVYFGDFTVNDKPVDLSHDPDWVGAGNRDSYQDHERGGAHHFGYSETTNYAGGAKAGEVGGTLWRAGKYAYYADRVGQLSLNDTLEASGKVVLLAGPPDSDMSIGWFSGASKEKSPSESGNFVGIHVGGPTRVGHYFSPHFVASDGTERHLKSAPVLMPQHQFDWKFRYDPAANNNLGEITVTLGDQSVTLTLRPGDKARGATLDRFGLFTSTIGGQAVKIYLDDLKYTAKMER